MPASHDDLVRPERYPIASRFDPAWVTALDMGPHPLWQLEDLLPDLALRPGMRVLDLGSGGGATSVMLARECGVEVVAADLWVTPERASQTLSAAGVADRVTAVSADVRVALPFDDDSFDAVVSVDAFEYFGTDVHLLPRLLKVVRPGGRIAMSTPALRIDPYDGDGPPSYVTELFGYETAAWHSPAWWQRHWELSGLVTEVHARMQEGGRDDWLLWSRVVDPESPAIAVLETDRAGEDQLGFALVSATAL